MPVTIGVDPHKASHTAVLDEHGRLLDRMRVPATLNGYQQLRQWAGRWPQCCWAVEGAHGLGRPLAQRLVGDGERGGGRAGQAGRSGAGPVSRARPQERPRRRGLGRRRRRRVTALRPVGVEDQAVALHLLTKRRQDLVAARTQTINRLHRLLVDLVPGGARRNLTANRAAALLARFTPAGQPAVTRHQLAAELIADIRQLEQRFTAVEAPHQGCGGPVQDQPGPAGRGRGGAGRHLPGRGRRHRPVSQQAPFRRSYGHRPAGGLQRPGHPPPAVPGRGPQAQPALYTMAMVQARRPSAEQAYYQHKLAEGKSPKEALRCLKRQLSDAVYRCLGIDQQRKAEATALA
jgi:transposase